MTLESPQSAVVLDPANLPYDYPRKFLSKDLVFNWENLEKIFASLEERTVGSEEDLKLWLEAQFELQEFISEESTVRQVRTTLQTDNKDFENAFLDYVQNYDPKIKKKFFDLDKKYISLPIKKSLVASRDSYYYVLDRKKDNSVALFREKNIELETKDDELSLEYRKIVGAMMVNFRGEEKTIYQMGKLLEEPDRPLRNEAWRATQARQHKDNEELDKLYDQFVSLRTSIAGNAGFDNFRDYAFRKKERFDYTVVDNLKLVAAIEKFFVPLSRKLDRQRKEDMKLDTLRPWDLRVDSKNRAPLRPFREISELLAGCEKIFSQIDPKLASYFSKMVELNLLDLESRKGKATGGYMTTFAEKRFPFIFMNAVGRDQDARTLLHECGHAFQCFLTRDKDFVNRIEAPLEFSEVASTTMELIGGEHIKDAFYDETEAKRSNLDELRQMIQLFPWVGTIDSFQHWVYTHPDHTADERATEWEKIFRRFQGLESWDGYEAEMQNRWHMQLHVFEAPFYYLEYAIATLGALGLWLKYRNDRKEAISLYENTLSLGGSKPLPELFSAAGLTWDFGETTVGKYARELEKILEEIA